MRSTLNCIPRNIPFSKYTYLKQRRPQTVNSACGMVQGQILKKLLILPQISSICICLSTPTKYIQVIKKKRVELDNELGREQKKKLFDHHCQLLWTINIVSVIPPTAPRGVHTKVYIIYRELLIVKLRHPGSRSTDRPIKMGNYLRRSMTRLKYFISQQLVKQQQLPAA